MIDRLAQILLLAGCGLFAAILAVEATRPLTADTEGAAAGSPAPAVDLPAAARARPGPRLEAMVTEILARPLFSSTRRPSPHSSGPAGDSALDDDRLTGIVTAPGYRFAIFAPAGAKPIVVREGDSIAGWRVEGITPHDVSLSGPAGTKTLQPKIDPNLVPPPPPGPPAVAPPGARPVPLAQPPRPAVPPGFANRMPMRPGLLRQPR
jgi:hypothetical protein